MNSPLEDIWKAGVEPQMVEMLDEKFRDLRVWEYISISKIKNSMFCPAYLHYLHKGFREEKIITPEGRLGAQIHDKLDVTPKKDVEPREAAVNNICAFIGLLEDARLRDKSSILSELPFFSPERRIWGYPDVLYLHNNPNPSIEIVERKTRMKTLNKDGTPYIFAEDIYQLYVQKQIIKDILKYLRITDKPTVNTTLELRVRDIKPDKTTMIEYSCQLANALENLEETELKQLKDNHHQAEYTIPVLFNKPQIRCEPMYCKINVDVDEVAKRFIHVTKTLLEESGGETHCACNCDPKKKRYCGYRSLCSERINQTTLGMFTAL